VGPQDPKDVSRDIARDLSSVVRELAAVSGDAHHWLKGPEYAKRDAKSWWSCISTWRAASRGRPSGRCTSSRTACARPWTPWSAYGVAVHRDRLEEMIAEATEEAERLKAELAEE
jgi:hypothetical protein